MFMNLLNFSLALILSMFVLLIASTLMKKIKGDNSSSSSFECGFHPLNVGLALFSFRFYLLANIFLIFDVELILLFPFLTKLIWVSTLISLGIFMLLFLILSLGLFHEWNQKMLEWAF